MTTNDIRKCVSPTCDRWIFFPAKKRGQPAKYCSMECANDAAKAQRLKWWHLNHGNGRLLPDRSYQGVYERAFKNAHTLAELVELVNRP